MGQTGAKRLVRQAQRVLKAAQRRQPWLAELVQTVPMLEMVRSVLKVPLAESLKAVSLSKVHPAPMLPHLPWPLVRSTQLIQQLQPALRHR